MKNFNSIEALQNNEELQKMGRYCWEKVKLNGEEVFACTTNQQYEDIIWSFVNEMLINLFMHFNINEDTEDHASEIRNLILDYLEENGIKFVDVFDEY